MTDQLAKLSTAVAVAMVAAVAAVISYRHAYELVSTHGESGLTARLVPFTVDGLIWAASMVMWDAGRRGRSVPPLAKWSLGVGIVATIGANVAHGLTYGPVGAVVSSWPALALVGAFELLMTLTRDATQPGPTPQPDAPGNAPEARSEPTRTEPVHTPESAVLADYLASLDGPGRPMSQRALAERHGIARRKVKQIITTVERPMSHDGAP